MYGYTMYCFVCDRTLYDEHGTVLTVAKQARREGLCQGCTTDQGRPVCTWGVTIGLTFAELAELHKVPTP
jgi:hypothetical protein